MMMMKMKADEEEDRDEQRHGCWAMSSTMAIIPDCCCC